MRDDRPTRKEPQQVYEVTRLSNNAPAAHFLAALPVRSELGGIVCAPVFYQLPEQLSIAFISTSPISSHQGISKTKTAGLPYHLDIAIPKIGNLTPVPVSWCSLSCKRIPMPIGGNPVSMVVCSKYRSFP